MFMILIYVSVLRFYLSTSGELCDLILVFFDPMGQALCKRTLSIVEKLNEKQGDRLRFYLSKADEAGGESDRQVNCSYTLIFIIMFYFACTLPFKVILFCSPMLIYFYLNVF